MTKRMINYLSYHEKLALANQKRESGNITAYYYLRQKTHV